MKPFRIAHDNKEQRAALWHTMTDDLPHITGKLLGSTHDDLLGTVWLLGHDLKSPVATIISTLEMLVSLYEDNPEHKTLVHMLRAALSAARRQYNMVSDTLDLARFEVQEYELERDLVDMGALIRDVLDSEHYTLDVKKLNMDIQIPDEPIMLLLDSEIVKRMISALIDNVMKFTVKDDLLRIKLSCTDTEILFQVSDTGRAFLPEIEELVMQRAPHWSQRQGGSRTSVGMGLPFISYAAQAHGGTFSAHSDLTTQITTFTLILPRITSEAE
jgi:signal transduction histidine kinase